MNTNSVERLTGPATSGPDHQEDVCGNTAIPARVAKASGAISPAISQAISPSTVENNTTETDGEKPCNQSGGQPSLKPNCYKCKHRADLSYSAHSECKHPLLSETDRLLAAMTIVAGHRIPHTNVSGSAHGIRNGWFMWPLNYDPVWLESCDMFEALPEPPRD